MVQTLLLCIIALSVGAWLFHRLRRGAIPYVTSIDTPLLRIGRKDRFTIREACEGVVIMGGVGSGKTSAPAKDIANGMLQSGMGGIVCCAKNDELERWLKLAKDNGRSKDVIVFDHTGSERFNFLDYARATIAKPGFETNLIQLLARVTDAARGQSQQSGGQDKDPFWRDAATQMVANAIPLLLAVHGTLRLKNLYQFITSAPRSPPEAADERWQLNSFCAHTLARAAHLANAGDRDAERAFEEHSDYWLKEFATLGEKTRGNIVTVFTSSIYPFLSGKLHELFCTDTTFAPAEFTREGLIIILALPTRVFGPAGAVAQQIVKLLWQMGVEAHQVTDRSRPVFCWADEAQFFMNSYDSEHLSVCRASRVCNVFITQDLPTFYAQLGSREEAEALVAKFQNRIFCANTDANTNNYASSIVGKTTKFNYTKNQSDQRNSGIGANTGEFQGGYSGGHGGNRGTSRGITSYQDAAIRPEFFGQELRNGGPKNRFKVDAIMLRAAGFYKVTKSNWIKAEFSQK